MDYNYNAPIKKEKMEIEPLQTHDLKITVKTEPVELELSCDPDLNEDHKYQVKEEIVVEINPDELHKESEDTHPDFLFVCNICSKIFEDKFTLTEHLTKEHSTPSTSAQKNCKPQDGKTEKQNIKSFSILCYAGKKEPSKKEVADMKEDDIGNEEKASENNTNNEVDVDPDNKCRICFKTFTRRNNLQRHIKQFHVSKNNKVYTSAKLSKTDCLVGHKEEEKEILVCQCGTKFFNKWSFAWHKKSYCVLKTSKPGT